MNNESIFPFYLIVHNYKIAIVRETRYGVFYSIYPFTYLPEGERLSSGELSYHDVQRILTDTWILECSHCT